MSTVYSLHHYGTQKVAPFNYFKALIYEIFPLFEVINLNASVSIPYLPLLFKILLRYLLSCGLEKHVTHKITIRAN